MKEYTEDLSVDLSALNADALFTPSAGTSYINQVSTHKERMENPDLERSPWMKDRNPKGFHDDGRELNFMREDSNTFYYPYMLISAGHANLNIDTQYDAIMKKESMMRSRDKDKSIVIGDSGGYQIGTGILNFDWENFGSQENDNLRLKILRWLEETADYSMSLDVPVWGISHPKCDNIKTYDQCLSQTVHNNKFFAKHRVPGKTRLLNVVHGRTLEEVDKWYDAVKDEPFEGWAFSSYSLNYAILLRLLLRMRNEGKLNSNQNWLHMLGVSKIDVSCAFSIIQRVLRKKVDPSITISYDASTPFINIAKAHLYQRFTLNRKKFGFSRNKMFDHKSLVGSNEPFPIMGPLSDKLTLGDLYVKGNDILDKNGDPFKGSLDSLGYLCLMNHNLYWHIKGVKDGNRLLRMPSDSIYEWVPDYLIKFREICEEAFSIKDFKEAEAFLQANEKTLNIMSKVKKGAQRIDNVAESDYLNYDGGLMDGEKPITNAEVNASLKKTKTHYQPIQSGALFTFD